MKSILTILSVLFISISYSQEEDLFLGNWINPKGDIIEIYKIQNAYYGKNALNPERIILIQLTKRNSKILYGGTVKNEDEKREFEVRLKLKNNKGLIVTIIRSLCNEKQFWRKSN